MSWIEKLYDTYVYCKPLIGHICEGDENILLPIAHTTQNAHIQFSVDMRGDFLAGTAQVITDKADSTTIIPCTEKSQNRTSAPVNHPLFDKLPYLAGDYTKFGGEKHEDSYKNYIKDLELWCQSPCSNVRVCAVLTYLKKGTLIADLVREHILPLDEEGKLIRKWDTKRYGEKQGVYRAGRQISDALDAFVRIDVIDDENSNPVLWMDSDVWDAYIAYFSTREGKKGLCYVQGTEIPCSNNSPAKIRFSGDKAKLISSNDTSGFTYLGRFASRDEVVQIGYETSQYAHNMLKWLIAKQGFHNGDQVYVTWGTKNQTIVPIENDSPSLITAVLGANEPPPYTYTEYVKKLNKMMAGYKQTIQDRDDMVTIGLDAATTGRMSIIYYEEFDGHTYLERLKEWYLSCVWRLTYLKKNEKGQYVGVFGTPSPKEILSAVYGDNLSDKLKKSAMERLMPCILNAKPIPVDFVLNAARKASQPMSMENWEYRKTLCVACALIRKYYSDREKREYAMALELENYDRSYLFGRVLAYYHYIEYCVLAAKGESRPTNALRLKNAYSRKPAKTMSILAEKVQPYINKVYGKQSKTIQDLERILSGIRTVDMTNEALTPIYLLGYSAQVTELFDKKGEKE